MANPHAFTAAGVRYVRDQLNGNTVDNGNHWVEIEVYGSRTQAYVGGYLEWNGSTAKMVKYYSAGANRVAMRTASGGGAVGLKWLVGDHLGSTSLTVDAANANKLSELRYKPWGELRYTWNTTTTDNRFTGQRQTGTGLVDFKARMYDPSIMRFVSPDSVVPLATQGTQALDRYAYANNNPINRTDPTGHTSETCRKYADDYCVSATEYMPDPEKYRVTFDDEMTLAQKRKVMWAVAAVATRLMIKAAAGDSTPSSSSSEIFTGIYGNLYIEITDVQYWGYAKGYDKSTGYIYLQVDPTVNWKHHFILQFLIHELGHLFAQRVRDLFSAGKSNLPPYSNLASEYYKHPTFPIRPEGFAGGQGSWQWNTASGRDGHADEFADMFLGWVLNEWALNTSGDTRAGWMDGNMTIWMSWIH